MGRYMAIDYGTKRTGIAVTDPMQMIATALNTVQTHALMTFLTAYFQTEDVEKMIVGKPLRLDGSESDSMKYVRQFVRAFKKRFPGIAVEWVDERFTSSLARDALLSGGMKKQDRAKKGHVDKISAVIILQSYLEAQNNTH